VYPIPLPEDDEQMFEKFKTTNKAMQDFDMNAFVPQNKDKCKNCIYNDFCDRPLAPKLYNGGF
jgi:CRISPR/Cas system-associated exonuclease Cas4 (RecB family)